jgi:mannose-6-phosphate isomerase-like protein (cupin superfamily)
MELDGHSPPLLGPGEGETVTDRPERTLRILGELDELIVTWFRYEPGEVGPDAHIHLHHTDAFYLLEGEIELSLGPDQETVRAEAGTLAAAPPNVVHTFRNASGATAIFLNVHAPSMGFGDHIRGREDSGFDQHEPPPDGGRPFADAVVSGPGAGERLTGSSTTIVKTGGDDCDGQLAVYETVLPVGGTGPPLHLHRRTAEMFFVLEGMLEVTIGGERALLEPGAFARVRPGVTHTFANGGETEVCCLTIGGPAGVEGFIREAVRTNEPLARLGAVHDTYVHGS